MNRLIEEKRDELLRLCAKYRVRRLELFGSALSDQFDPATSDLDFLVEFLPLQAGERADAYFELLNALRELFQRNVDLVMAKAIRNRYFLESINRSRTLLYAA
jgi:predicted nucleotidyltransferase